jgi:hypothetical protein
MIWPVSVFMLRLAVSGIEDVVNMKFFARMAQ